MQAVAVSAVAVACNDVTSGSGVGGGGLRHGEGEVVVVEHRCEERRGENTRAREGSEWRVSSQRSDSALQCDRVCVCVCVCVSDCWECWGCCV